jgi:hypothetical protein
MASSVAAQRPLERALGGLEVSAASGLCSGLRPFLSHRAGCLASFQLAARPVVLPASAISLAWLVPRYSRRKEGCPCSCLPYTRQMPPEVYSVYVRQDTGTMPADIFKDPVPAAARFYGTVVHPAAASGKPVFTATASIDHGPGSHQIYLVGHDSVPICYVNVKVLPYKQMFVDVPLEMVATTTDIKRRDMQVKNPMLLLVTWTETAEALKSQHFASDLLPVLAHYGRHHGAQALLSQNTVNSGRYERYFGQAIRKKEIEPEWLGIKL